MYRIKPIVNADIEDFLKKMELIDDMIGKVGSPMNILFPENMDGNIDAFKAVFEKYSIHGKIFFAHKPNKSKVFPTQAHRNGINIDVASIKELENALNAGFPPDRIEATGPKSKHFLKLCVENEIYINVDSLFELKKIAELSKTLDKKSKVIIRLSNFESTSIQVASKIERFGIEYVRLNEIFGTLSKYQDFVELLGFSFHINNNSLEERVVAFENILSALLKAQQLGFVSAKVLNIGGGFQPNYVENKNDWDDFIRNLKEFVAGNSKERISFTGTKFGYYYDGLAIKGNYTFQDFFNSAPKEKFLDKILSIKLPSFEDRSIGEIISENLFELWIEPGQSLLDQCGITIARVIGVKEVKEENIIFAEMNYTNLDSDRYELFTDPILLKNKPGLFSTKGYFISGNLCLSIDLIANHKIYLDTIPEPDDLLVFINTAPYRMDFVESEPLQNPVAKKVVWHGQTLISEEDYISQIKQ